MCSSCLVKSHSIIVHHWGLISHIHCSWSRQFLEIYSWNLLYILDIKWPNQLESSLFFYADGAITIYSRPFLIWSMLTPVKVYGIKNIRKGWVLKDIMSLGLDDMARSKRRKTKREGKRENLLSSVILFIYSKGCLVIVFKCYFR